jgi:uncharacterized delta-60 repeat protein
MKKLFSVRTIILAGSLLLQLNTLCFQSRGAAGDVDLSFDAGSGFINGSVRAVARQPNGKLIIGGEFTAVKDLVRYKIARLNADGSGDGTFDVDPNSGITFVHSIALQSDGMVLVGHDNGIARLNADGSRDTNFTLPLVVNDGLSSPTVFYVAVQSDGKILIGGLFTVVNSTSRSGIARLNADGSLDSTFDPGAGVQDTILPVVTSIAVQSDGKVLIVGGFNAFNNTFRPNIARLNADGSLDSTFDPGAGANFQVNSVTVQPNGKVLVGGDFTTVNGTNRGGIARLNTDGSLDESLNPGTGANGSVFSVALQSDDKVLIGGFFIAVNGTSRKYVARLNADGSLDGTFDPGSGPRAQVFALAVQPDGKVLVGVDITGTGVDFDLLTRLNADGSRDATFIPGGGVLGASSLTLQPDGKVLFAGAYDLGNGTAMQGICRVNSDGSLDGTFTSAGRILGANSITVQPDGKVLFGGYFSDVNRTNHGGITRLNADGSLDSSFNTGTGVDYPVRSIALQFDGKVLIGGGFYTVNGTDRPGLARLNSDGSLDTSFDPHREDLGSSVICIAQQPDGKVLIGGDAILYPNGTLRGGITRLNTDGSLDNSFNLGRFGFVSSIVLRADGKMFIGGATRSTIDYRYPTWVARLHADGSLDSTFVALSALDPGPGTLGARSIALQPDGKVLCLGSYYLGNGDYFQGLYRLHADASLDSTFNPSDGLPLVVDSIASQPDGNVLIAHGFDPIKGVMRPYLARLRGDSVAPSLNIARSNAFVIVSWPVTALNFQLQESTNLSLPNFWSPIAQSAVTNAGQISVTVSTTVGRKFFRLKSQ